MPERQFEITITPDGEVEVHIQGSKGKLACHNAAAIFQKVVGHLESLKETHEYYEPEENVRIDQHH